MFNIKDLKPFFDKATMEINGMTFRLTDEYDLAGELAVWYSEKYKVLATPGFDNVPVPVEVLEIDGDDYNSLDVDSYDGEVKSFEQYAEIVKTLTKRIINNYN